MCYQGCYIIKNNKLDDTSKFKQSVILNCVIFGLNSAIKYQTKMSWKVGLLKENLTIARVNQFPVNFLKPFDISICAPSE
jgi:hypothetical protein